MMTTDKFRARAAFFRFKHALESLQVEMDPIRQEMSPECRFELDCLGKIARSFFRMANEEVFGKAGVAEKVTK